MLINVWNYVYLVLKKRLVTKRSVYGTEQNCEENEGSVPFVSFRDCAYTQKHENDGFRTITQHFQSTSDSGEWRGRHVLGYVIFHGYSAKEDSGEGKIILLLIW